MTNARARAAKPVIKEELRRATEQAFAAGLLASPVLDGESGRGVDRLDQVERRLATGGW